MPSRPRSRRLSRKGATAPTCRDMPSTGESFRWERPDQLIAAVDSIYGTKRFNPTKAPPFFLHRVRIKAAKRIPVISEPPKPAN